MRPFVFLVFLVIAWCSPVSSSGQLIGTDVTLEELFLYSDLVVEGVIEEITKVTVPIDDYLPGVFGRDIPMAVMKFRVDTVLIGYHPTNYASIVANVLTSPSVYYFDFIEGERYILSLHLPAKGKLFESGRYLVRSDTDKFFLKGNRWIQGSKSNQLAEGERQELYNVLAKVRRYRSIEYLTKQAELIVRGVMLDSWAVKEQTSEGIDKNITRIRFEVHSALKGVIKESPVIISTIVRGLYMPSWRTRVPDMHVGEEWILFLKSADEPGYYPFAGVNGLFMVEGHELLRNYNNRVLLGLSVEQLEAEVLQIVEGGE